MNKQFETLLILMKTFGSQNIELLILVLHIKPNSQSMPLAFHIKPTEATIGGVLYKKDVLKNTAKLTGKYLC